MNGAYFDITNVVILSYCEMKIAVAHTILDAALKVVDNGSQDGGQVHHMSTLSETQSEELVPTGSHQIGVFFLPGKEP